MRTELARSTVLLEVPPGLARRADRRNRRRRTTAGALTAGSGVTPRQPPATAYVVSHITKALDALTAPNEGKSLVEIPVYRGDLYVTALARHTPHP